MEKKRKIVVVSGSPRRGGNTELLVEAFVKGARGAGHEVEVFEAGHKKINGCRACQKCYTNGAACVFNDDFNELAPMIEAADTVVFATPLYWFSFTAQVKAAIDKLYALYVGKRDVKVADTMLMVCAETDQMKDFEGIVRSYELITDYLGWNDLGRILVPEVNNPGDILKTDAPARAEKAGREL